MITEAIVGDFQKGVRRGKSLFVPHAIDLAKLPAAPKPPPQLAAWKDKLLIVHTGVVEILQREGLRRFSSFLAKNPDLNAKLVLSTPNSHTDLRRYGLDSRAVSWKSLQSARRKCWPSNAPPVLCFWSSLPFYADAIKSFTIGRPRTRLKTVEYLTSGVRFIYAHIPADSYYATHIRKHGYAFVADETSDEYLRKTFVANHQRPGVARSTHQPRPGLQVNLRSAPASSGSLWKAVTQIDPSTLREPLVS